MNDNPHHDMLLQHMLTLPMESSEKHALLRASTNRELFFLGIEHHLVWNAVADFLSNEYPGQDPWTGHREAYPPQVNHSPPALALVSTPARIFFSSYPA